MVNFMRFILSIVGASVLTVVLFVFMNELIRADFVPEEDVEQISFELNPSVEDLPVVEEAAEIEKVAKVDTPPPPPQIERQATIAPKVPIATISGAIPDFETPTLDSESFSIAVSDRDAQPLVRIPPLMPERAEKSGHCRVRFDVSVEGAPFNVSATTCTQSLFKRAAIKSVLKWKYNPKIQEGIAVSYKGVESKITFQLMDDRGRLIPE